jgi:hypothetical protein
MRIDFVERIEGLRLEKTSPYPLQSTGEGTPLAVPRGSKTTLYSITRYAASPDIQHHPVCSITRYAASTGMQHQQLAVA